MLVFPIWHLDHRDWRAGRIEVSPKPPRGARPPPGPVGWFCPCASLWTLRSLPSLRSRFTVCRTPPPESCWIKFANALRFWPFWWSNRLRRFFIRPDMKKAPGTGAFVHGRAGRIRTDDPFTPSEVRYQTALQPVSVNGRAKKQGSGGMASKERPVVRGLGWQGPY